MAYPHDTYGDVNTRSRHKIDFWFTAEEISDATLALDRLNYRASPSGMYQFCLPLDSELDSEGNHKGWDSDMEEDHCVCVICAFCKDDPSNYGELCRAVDVPRTYCISCGTDHEDKVEEEFTKDYCPQCNTHFETNEDFCWSCNDSPDDGCCSSCCDCVGLLDHNIQQGAEGLVRDYWESWLVVDATTLAQALHIMAVGEKYNLPAVLVGTQYPHLKEQWMRMTIAQSRRAVRESKRLLEWAEGLEEQLQAVMDFDDESDEYNDWCDEQDFLQQAKDLLDNKAEQERLEIERMRADALAYGERVRNGEEE
jgi:hypothetical protein